MVGPDQFLQEHKETAMEGIKEKRSRWPEYLPADSFVRECLRAEIGRMDPNEAVTQVAMDIAHTTGEERQFLRDLVMKPAETDSFMYHADYVTPTDITRFRSPGTKYELDFSSARCKPQDLFGPYFEGRTGAFKGKKVKKSEVARFGHLEKSAAENFSKVFSKRDNDRFATFEFMAICCLYFQVEPIYAVTLFHKCTNMGELMSYKTIGGALWLFLERKAYDYEKYVKACCRALRSEHSPLPDAVARSRYWKEVYAEAMDE